MALHHRHKQRILTTIVTLVAFTIAIDAYLILQPILDMDVALLFSFAVAIGVITAYQCYNYRHSHEHLTLVNTLTQIFLGTVLFTSAVLILILHAIFGLDVLDSYLALSVVVILLTFLFLKQFDQFLEKEVARLVPHAPVPTPKAAEKAPEKKELNVKNLKKPKAASR